MSYMEPPPSSRRHTPDLGKLLRASPLSGRSSCPPLAQGGMAWCSPFTTTAW